MSKNAANLRRDFLKACSVAGLGVAMPVSWSDVARADDKTEKPSAKSSQANPPYDGPFYAVFNASGGWDTTYMMDPKGVDGLNRLYKEGDIQTHGAHKFAPIKKHIKAGVSNETFFKTYGDELLTLNGLDYSVNNHSPCSRYMATGKLDSLAYPTFAALVAGCRSPHSPIAFLTFGNYSATGNVVPMSRVPYIHSLQKLANADGVNGSDRHRYHDDFAGRRIEEALEEQAQARVSKHRLPRIERAQSMLYAAQVNSKALQRVTPYIPKKTPKGQLPSQIEIALASFKAGVCVSANFSLGQFDSHANNDVDQMKLIPDFLFGIDYMIKRAEELKIRDKLVIVIQSEMGRTPSYNKGNGKDHWSIGSIMFMGPGIKGNRVIGATDEKQFLVPIDSKTLKLQKEKEKGTRVRPEHIHTALRELAGIEDHAFSKQFPLKVEEEEKLVGLWG